ncbi:c-type cytochrome [Halobacillus litoralis]|uniref:c-type cytochrome n=1 Tax=Halobacillus litoralis TaxID=45668 RepID=UPI001CFCFBB1|nr:c-type cytochrome [Halobacillus litoralis]
MKKVLFTLMLGLVLVLSACGGGGDEGSTDEGTNDTTEEQTDEGMDESTDESTDENADEGMDEESNEDAEEGGEGDTVDTAAAEKVFQNNCASCHGGDLGGGFGPALTNVGADYSADEIVNIIKNGKGQMPAQEGVSDEDAQLVASWLETKK